MKKIFEIYAEEGPRIIRTPGVYFLNAYMKIEKLKEYTESDLLEAPDGMDIDSQYYGLAFCYHVGFGMNKDEKKAFQWFLKAAKRGHKDASFYVAKCHENGQCVKKDSKKAFEWFLKAAEREHKDAIFSVAECYENGKGVKKDSKKAVQWYTKSVATLKALNDALEKKKNSSDMEVEEDKDNCSICHSELPKAITTLIECGHSFCTKCILTWFKQKNTCPMCRKSILAS